MVEKRCFQCGMKLKETTFNSYWCSNCGKLLGNQNITKEENNKKNKSYIG